MRISVVINTFNRCESLKKTLRSLRFQTFDDFEVIIVNGPSTDKTNQLLETYCDEVKVIECPIRNLSISRNLGIDNASGDIIAFIDDDSIATPNWLLDLHSAYQDDEICGVGGKVYDNTGLKAQFTYCALQRLGAQAIKEVSLPLDSYTRPFSDPFLTLIGTNASFLRSSLEKVDGFDEEYEYYLDETDVCMRLIDSGHKIKSIDNAVVHHKFLPSYLRDKNKNINDPYFVSKNTIYFSLQDAKARKIEIDEKKLNAFIAEILQRGEWRYKHGELSYQQFIYYKNRFAKGCQEGFLRGKQVRKTRKIRPVCKNKFLKFSTIIPCERRLRLCFASSVYPPHHGGISRYTHDLATFLAHQGHEVHVITDSDKNESYVDVEEDVWIHRLVRPDSFQLQGISYRESLLLGIRNYLEASRIHAENPLSLFLAPMWMVEGAVAACTREFPTVVTLMTTYARMISMNINPSFSSQQDIKQIIAYERAVLQKHEHVHAISQSIKDITESDYGVSLSNAFIVPLFVQDFSSLVKPYQSDDKVRLLFVGRIEPRKGLEVFLAAAEIALDKCPDLHIVLVGKNIEEQVYNPIKDFLSQYKHKKSFTSRVSFVGEVSDEELYQHYANCDLFCLPSRYESFGLVLLEAMVMSKPCIASDAGGAKEIVVDGETGFIFKGNQSFELAEKIILLTKDKELREKMGKKGRERYDCLFSPASVTKDLLKYFIKIENASKLYVPSSKIEIINEVISLVMSTGVSELEASRLVNKAFILSEITSKNNSLIHDFLRKISSRLNRNFPVIHSLIYPYAYSFFRKSYPYIQKHMNVNMASSLWSKIRKNRDA